MRILLGVLPLFLVDCGPGWSVAGYKLTPDDSTSAGLHEILDADSIKHIYREKLNYDGFDYCLIHWTYEDVKKVKDG